MNLTVKNGMGEQFNIVVIRYFKFNGGNYLIFTKNEIDEVGYQKLYISKINNMMGISIDDEIEWNLVRDTIKVIAKANKDNTTLPVQDLNENEINGIQIMGQKPFKLTASSVELLSANKSVQPVLNTMPNIQQQPVVNTIENVVPSISNVPVSNEHQAPMVNQQVVTPVSMTTPNVNDFSQQNGIPISPVMGVPSNAVESNFNNMNISPVEQNNAIETNVAQKPMELNNQGDLPSIDAIVPPTVQNVPLPVQQTQIEPLDFSATLQQPTPIEPVIDYKKLYEEQVLKINNLTTELDKYKAIVEQLKNILN